MSRARNNAAPPESPGPLPPEALRQLLDGTSAVVAVKDLEGRYVYVNRAFTALMGGDPDNYLGRTDSQIFNAEMAAQLRANDQQVLAQRRELVFEEVLQRDGQRRSYSVRKYPLLDTDGAPWAVCLTAEDVTAARRTDEALRRVALGIAGASGSQVFELTVSSVAAVLGVELAFVAALEPSPAGPRLATLAMHKGGRTGGRYDYAVAGTPCELVLARGFEYYSESAAKSFAGDPMLAAAGYVSYAGYPLVGSSGAPAGVLSVCHTAALPAPELVESILAIFAVRTAAEMERVRMDQALHDSELSYRTIFEATDDCIFIHDIHTGAIVDVNPRVCETSGYDYDQILRMRPEELLTGEPPYTTADAARHLARARKGEVVKEEWRRRNADGSEHWEEVRLKRVRLAGIDRILAVTRDITERKEREDALARSEDRLRATVEAALDCIITMDSGGRIREFNPAAEACFGYRRSEILGRSLAELIIPPHRRRAHQEGIERYMRSGKSRMLGKRMEMTAMRADGSEFPVELAIAEAQGVDGVVFVGYLRDITLQREAEQARVQLEAQLRQAQKMEAIGHLAGGVAHDFNNILTGVMGYLGMAEDAAEAGSEKLRKYLQQARYSGLRATELIQQMLIFSRGQQTRPRLMAPGPLIREALQLVRAAMPDSLSFVIDLEEAVPAVMSDPVQLEQVLMNLCINARDAMAGEGTLEIGLGRIEISDKVCSSCQQPLSGRYVELRVGDSGPGVPPEVMQRMFEPFFSTKPQGHGSGMGLATVHGIMHDQGGHLLVRNRSDTGALFSVLLPVADGQPAPDGKPVNTGQRPEPAAVLQGRVLLVDDDSTARGFMTELLQEWGLEVAAFDSAPAALEAIVHGRGEFHAAVLDYVMPKMNGLELAREIHAHQPSTQVLLYSGYAEGLADADLEAAGVRAQLGKPVDTIELFRHLEQILPAG